MLETPRCRADRVGCSGVGEEGLMQTLDPEVRADVEAAAHVLAAHQPSPRQR